MSHVFVGIDGGGTRARAVVLSEQGSELARVTGPAGIVDPADPVAAADNASRLLVNALAAADLDPPAAGLCCGLAGAGRPQEREAVRVALALTNLARSVTVTSDAEVAMTDAFDDRSGVLLIAGTGSIAWARTPHGAAHRVGGWGTLLGDEGSAYSIGLAALRAVAAAADRRGPPTALTRSVLDYTGVADASGLIVWVAAADKAAVAALAHVVISCAAEGDTVAARIRARAVAELAELAASAASRAGLQHPDIALAGGLIEPGGPLRDDVVQSLLRTLPTAAVIDRAVDAARGAAAIAIAMRERSD